MKAVMAIEELLRDFSAIFPWVLLALVSYPRLLLGLRVSYKKFQAAISTAQGMCECEIEIK
jgi:hypothetical protein